MSSGIKLPVPQVEPRFLEELDQERITELLAGAQKNFDYLAGLFPVAAENLANDANGKIVTALPASGNYKGRRITYAADASKGVYWQFAYTGASPYPWSFVGGPPLVSEVDAAAERTSATYGALTASAGPELTAPLGGDYDLELGMRVFEGIGGQDTYMTIKVGAAAAADADAVDMFMVAASGANVAGARARRVTAVAAASLLVAQYRTSGGGKMKVDKRWLRVTPVRVG